MQKLKHFISVVLMDHVAIVTCFFSLKRESCNDVVNNLMKVFYLQVFYIIW